MEGILVVLGALFLTGIVLGLIKIVFDLVVELARIVIILAAVAACGYLAYLIVM